MMLSYNGSEGIYEIVLGNALLNTMENSEPLKLDRWKNTPRFPFAIFQLCRFANLWTLSISGILVASKFSFAEPSHGFPPLNT